MPDSQSESSFLRIRPRRGINTLLLPLTGITRLFTDRYTSYLYICAYIISLDILDYYTSVHKMTLPDNIECATEQSTRRPTDIGMALREVLVKALANNRLTSGVFSCVTLLNTQPEDVSVCVLPDVGPQMDVTINIQHKLLEAYCWENDIPVLRVDSGDKLSAILKSTAANNNASEMSDTSCVLVQNPVASTKEDALINKFYNDVMASDIYPRPIIQLPV